MNHSAHQSKGYFRQQLVYLDENIKELTDLYFSSTPFQERVKHFFHLYLLEVEELIRDNQNKDLISFFPKVYIGTKVTVLYDEENETEDYIICFPEDSNPDAGYISFLSPVGRQLLLKNNGEQLSLLVPTGAIPVTIKDISYAGNLFVSCATSKEA